MKYLFMASCLLAAAAAFAQGFGGQQSGNDKMEYSEKFADVNYVGDGKGRILTQW